MSDQIAVQLTGSAAGLQTAMQESAETVSSARAKINSDLEEVSVVSERVSGRLEHLGISMTFAANALADGSEMGVTRAAHALAGLGFAINPAVGALSVALALAAERIVAFFTKASEESDKAAKQFDGDIGQMANSLDAAGLNKKARDIWLGTPFDENGQLRGASAGVSGAFNGSLADLRNRMEYLQAQLKPGGFLTTDIENQGIFRAINKLKPDLEKAEEEFRKVQTAIDVMQSRPAETGIVAVRSTAKRADAPDDLDKKAGEFLTKQEAAARAWEKIWTDHLDGVAKYYDDIAKDTDKIAANQTKQLADMWKDAQATIRTASDQQAQDYEATQKKTLDDVTKEWATAFSGLTNAWNAAVQKIQNGTDSVKNFWRDMWHEIVRNSLESLLRIQVAHAAHWAAVHGITAASVAVDVATVIAGVLKKIAAYAAEAAAAAWAAISAIPYVGPFLAPAVAAATLAGVLALASNIGGGGSGHASASASSVGAVGHGAPATSSASAAPSTTTHNYNIYAVDSKSFHEMAMANAPSIAKAAAAGAAQGVGLRTAAGRRG